MCITFNPFLHDFLFLTGKKFTSLKYFPDYGKNNKKNFKLKVWKLYGKIYCVPNMAHPCIIVTYQYFWK